METKTTLNTIQLATTADRAAIVDLLESLHLPTVDLPVTLDNFVIAKDKETVVGCGGLELYGSIALLRSLAVATHLQGQGLGNLLYRAALDLALEKGIQEVYLITTTAADFFLKQDFRKVERAQVPTVIQQTAQFTSVCPTSATIMQKTII
ncbi:arsenic resistance N-acetyltransferase ArsN2 [Adhaeribacter radiodurans]|uniref:GNAT family N-acetyltransferase n=1 Tax=Adhaeribacter radiodurans TaxID=2745197 RepID=A0A7L7L151_9BACT|nr:arsenic resistance N-acetyltransferase ArsN2 [Adhaeribacter radiodurans]QMU26517.1 GNAT family N-acetyltransferase [Adhaeribacter radiodurans]